MGIVVKIIGIIMAIVIAVGAVGTAICVGSNLVQYMAKQGFDLQTAFAWSWQQYTEKINDVMKGAPIFGQTTEIETYVMTNQKVDVVACTNL